MAIIVLISMIAIISVVFGGGFMFFEMLEELKDE